MFEHTLATFAQHRERHSKAAVRRFGSSDGLKQQVHGRATFHRFQLRSDVGEAAGLRGNFVRGDHALQCSQNGCAGFH